MSTVKIKSCFNIEQHIYININWQILFNLVNIN